jgi:hypothetical protein
MFLISTEKSANFQLVNQETTLISGSDWIIIQFPDSVTPIALRHPLIG